MNTTHNRFTRVLCTILSLALLLTTIPLTMAQAEDEPTGVVSFGAYSEKAVLWNVVKSTDSAYLLIAKNVLAKGSAATKFNSTTTAFPDYGTSALATYVTGTLLPATFTEAQQTKLATFTTTYVVNNEGTATNKTVDAKMSIPSAADIPEAFLTKAALITATGATATNYWTADGSCTNATDKKVVGITSMGQKGTPAQNVQTFGVRPVISIAKADLLALAAVEGCSFTDAAGNAINYVVRGEGFKIALAEAYNQSTVTVKSGETALTADENGVYTVPADATALTIEGVQANPADFTAYDEAITAAQALDPALYTEETWAAVKAFLDNPLNKDDYTAADQADINSTTADLNAAVAALAYRPADFTNFDKAYDELTEIKNKGDAGELYDLTPKYVFNNDYTDGYAYEEGMEGVVPKTLSAHIKAVLNQAYKKDTIHTYTIERQADVDNATAALNFVASKVGYLSANTTAWKASKEYIEGLDDSMEVKYLVDKGDVYLLVDQPLEDEELKEGRNEPFKYLDVEQAKAACAAIIAEHNYETDLVDCTHQEEVDAAAARLEEIAAPYRNGEKYAPTNFDWLNDVLNAAEQIDLADYITTEEYMADGQDEDTGEYVNLFYYGEDGEIADDIRVDFEKALADAQAVDREANKIKFQSQSNIDGLAEKLAQNMVRLTPLKRLTKMQKINMKIKAFFQKIINFFKMIKEISQTLWGLLGMLRRGEIDLYSVFEMVGLDQKYLDILIKLGIKPHEDPEEPEEPEAPAAGGLGVLA